MSQKRKSIAKGGLRGGPRVSESCWGTRKSDMSKAEGGVAPRQMIPAAVICCP